MNIAILAGASGLVGSALLDQLLQDADFESVIVVVRAPLTITNKKLTTILVDFEKIEEQTKDLSATHAFCCLGTTIKKAGSKEVQYHIDHDYVVAFAKACKQIGVQTFSVVSSVGADALSKNFYLNTKGRTDDDLTRIGFEKLIIVRPSLLLGNRKEFRLGEKIATLFMKLLSPLLVGSLKKYKGIKAETVARALIYNGKLEKEGVFVIDNNGLLV